jgi:hypothetical protein
VIYWSPGITPTSPLEAIIATFTLYILWWILDDLDIDNNYGIA